MAKPVINGINASWLSKTARLLLLWLLCQPAFALVAQINGAMDCCPESAEVSAHQHHHQLHHQLPHDSTSTAAVDHSQCDSCVLSCQVLPAPVGTPLAIIALAFNHDTARLSVFPLSLPDLPYRPPIAA